MTRISHKLLSSMGVAAFGLIAIVGTHHSAAAAGRSSAQVPPQPEDGALRCSQLAGKQFAGATVDRAEFVASGAALPPLSEKLSRRFCRVDARVSPVAGSEIKVQIWLPDQWNGKFVGVGGGGFEGGYANASLVLRAPISEGYAGVVTNAGHDPSPEPKWALRHPAKLVDFGHRGNHLGAVVGKAVVAAYYGKPAKRAYFWGCSNGGRDALMLAQRHPDDYDAIAVGAPANDWTGLFASFGRDERLTAMPGVDLTSAKLKLVHDAVLTQCDSLDGVKDGLIERPSACRFDPAPLQCKSAVAGICLSAADVNAVREFYRGTYLRDGYHVMPGLAPGSEYQWAGWRIGPAAASAFVTGLYRYMVYDDPSWNVSRFDLERDYPVARKQLGAILDAVDPDLRPFLKRGGKLLMYHGWDDAAISPGNTLRYYAAMKRASGRRAAQQTRLFMMPGVAHCLDGNGPSLFDEFAELDRWSQSGKAPERIIATKPDNIIRGLAGLPTKVVRARPLCAWPKVARYKGTGSIDEAQNFTCR